MVEKARWPYHRDHLAQILPYKNTQYTNDNLCRSHAQTAHGSHIITVNHNTLYWRLGIMMHRDRQIRDAALATAQTLF